MRLIWIVLGLVALVLIPFFIWGDVFSSMFVQQGAISWLQAYGGWAWVVGIVLLVADLVLPLPATVIMSALGYLYGPLLGGLMAAGGSFLAGTLAYALCRSFGRPMARWIAGEDDLQQGERLFSRAGGWLVALSRWLPVFPEVVACMAGLTRMQAGSFHVALLCGSVPLGFTFAAVGYAGVERPVLALVLSAVLPAAFWLVIRPIFSARLQEA